MSQISTELAAWEHERRDSHGRWVRGGLVEQLMKDAMPWQFNIRTRGRTEPQKGDLAWMERPGRFRLVGRVVLRAGNAIMVDADDGQRHLIAADTMRTVRADPIPREGGLAPDLGLEKSMDPVGVQLDPHPPNPAAPWLVKAAGGAEWHVNDKGADEIRGELKRRQRAAGVLPPSPPGEMITPGVKQYLLPGMPEPGTEYGQHSDPVKRLAALLPGAKQVIESQLSPDPASRTGNITWPDQGNQGAVAVVELPDGTKVITKSQDPVRNDREELSYYVSQAIGGGLPAVARDPANPRDIIEDYLPGDTLIRYSIEQTRAGGDWDGYNDEQVEEKIIASGGTGDIGMLDYLTGNDDRHEANVIVDSGGNASPIDMGMAQFDAAGTDSPFWGGHQWGETWDAADIADMRRELAKIQPEFIRLGHPDWYANMIWSAQELTGESLPKDEFVALLSGAQDVVPPAAPVPQRETELSHPVCGRCGCSASN
jgi:hypothetical protein